MVTKEFIDSWIEYSPTTGVFTWKQSNGRFWNAGDIAGCKHSAGYINISFPKSNQVLAHRLAWFIVHNEWPSNDIDHIDGNRKNNAISNLRHVNRSLNNQNRYKKSVNKSTDMIGVSKRSDYCAYDARISVNGKQKCLGTFKTPEEARAAYMAAKETLHELQPLK